MVWFGKMNQQSNLEIKTAIADFFLLGSANLQNDNIKSASWFIPGKYCVHRQTDSREHTASLAAIVAHLIFLFLSFIFFTNETTMYIIFRKEVTLKWRNRQALRRLELVPFRLKCHDFDRFSAGGHFSINTSPVLDIPNVFCHQNLIWILVV